MCAYAVLMQAVHRITPLVLVGVVEDTLAEQCARAWADRGAVIVRAHSAQGCLRVATSVGPDVIVVDPRFGSRLISLLKAHPTSRSAHLVRASRSAWNPVSRSQTPASRGRAMQPALAAIRALNHFATH
jgi:hypothetical protein